MNLYKELDIKLDDLDESISQYEREEKQLEINSKIETLKSFLQEYQKRNNELQLIADVKDTPKLLNNLENILDTRDVEPLKYFAVPDSGWNPGSRFRVRVRFQVRGS